MEKQQHSLAFDTEMSYLEPSKFTLVFSLNSCQCSVCNGNPVETLGEKELKINATFSAAALSNYIPKGLAELSHRDRFQSSSSIARGTALVCIWESLPEYKGDQSSVSIYQIREKWQLSVTFLEFRFSFLEFIPSCSPWLMLMCISLCLWKWSENPPTMVLKGSYFEETLDFNKCFLGLKKIVHRQVKCAGRACERGG